MIASTLNSRLTLLIPIAFASLVLASSFWFVRASPSSTTLYPPPIVQARLGPGTEGLTKQAALHMSKLQSGNSVGGFPGFEPPQDDDEYRAKIQTRSYSARDVNDWVREINNFLNQIARKNPKLTLEEILKQQGLTQAQVNDYLEGLRTTYRIASDMQKSGVRPITVQTLRSVLLELGVTP